MNPHLNDEQISDALLGAPSPHATAHLTGCSHCQAELARMSGALGEFRSAVQGWSTAPACPLPALAPAPPTRRLRVWLPLAAAAALAVVLTLPALHRQPSPVAVVGSVDSAAQIARDNQLLASISVEVGATAPIPMQSLRLDSATAPAVSDGSKE